MQRSFSSFPAGWPGAGLLLLRATVGATALAQGIATLTLASSATFGAKVSGVLATIIGLALLIGFLTPIAGLVIALGNTFLALSWFPLPISNLLDSPFATIFVIIMAIAIVFLGPGAFSLDARLFGRREIVIPSAPRAPQP